MAVVDSTVHQKMYPCLTVDSSRELSTVLCIHLKKLTSSTFHSSFSPQFSTPVKISQIWAKLNKEPRRLYWTAPMWLPAYPCLHDQAIVVHPNMLHRAQATGRIWSNSLQCANFTLGITLVSILVGLSFVWIFCNSMSSSSRISWTKWNLTLICFVLTWCTWFWPNR